MNRTKIAINPKIMISKLMTFILLIYLRLIKMLLINTKHTISSRISDHTPIF